MMYDVLRKNEERLLTLYIFQDREWRNRRSQEFLYSQWLVLLSGLPVIGVHRNESQFFSLEFSAESLLGGHSSMKHGKDDSTMRSLSSDSSSTVGSHSGDSWKNEFLEKEKQRKSHQEYESKKSK